MPRLSEPDLHRELEAVRATSDRVSARFTSNAARSDFDRAAADLVRAVEERVSHNAAASATPPKPGTATGGGSAVLRGDGGQTAAPRVEANTGTPHAADPRQDPDRGRHHERGEARGDHDRAASTRDVPLSREAALGVSVESGEERLRERLERERAQDRGVER